MVADVVIVEQAGPVTTLLLNRAAKRNAIGVAGWVALRRKIEAAAADTRCRVVVIRGGGGNFGAGADISEFSSVFATAEGTLAYFESMEATMQTIERCPIPVVAAIEGLCIGTCVALTLACDIRLASDDSIFAITPAKLGIAYPFGDIARVVRTVGPGMAKLMLFTGGKLTARQAADAKLIDSLAVSGSLSERS